MNPKKRLSLRLKLVFFATLLVGFVALTFSFFVIRAQKQAVVESQEASREDMVRGIQVVAREAILVDDDTDMVKYMDLLKRNLKTAYAMVLYPDGRVRVHTDPLLIGKRLDDPASQKTLENRSRGKILTQNLSTPQGREVFDLAMPIMIGLDPPEFQGVARMGFDKESIDRLIEVSMRQEMSRIGKALFISLLVGFLGAVIIAALITKPLETLQKGSHLIGEGKLDHRIPVHTNDELGDLADEFNLMAQKLGELDQMKQDFVSSVTHELRSPMTSIRGYMDLLLKGAAGPLSTEQKDYLTVIKNNAVRLGRFIDNLLDVAKIEARKLKLTPEPQNIYELAHEMQVLFKPQADQKKLTIKNTIPKDLPELFVDKDKVAEVFINLTSNAVKFTPEGGEVTFSAKEGSNYLEVVVEDTGPGVPADQADKLFNKFEQVNRDKNQGLRATQKGTGLGLAIVKGIIEGHGGKISVKSPASSGKGTAFCFTLPKLTDEIRARISEA